MSQSTVVVPTSINPTQGSRWEYLDNIRKHAGPFTTGYEPEHSVDSDGVLNSERRIQSHEDMKIFGAGGLGCEILKNLALSGFKDIHVIDMDTIDVSNLNRQFLFRHSDVGKFKAEVAARFVTQRVKGVSIVPHNCKIQDKDDDFYEQFNIVVCGLDSIEARRWINTKLVEMIQSGIDIIPLIDGGTEGLQNHSPRVELADGSLGFKGQSRVIIPMLSSCIECQLDMHAPRAAVPLCTLATIPRQPEHCIEWAHIMAWEQEKPFPKLDNDDPEHITWLWKKALKRAEEFNIAGVTYSLTQGVVKNIIPAIASTNAIIAASCCNEVFKIATSAATALGLEENYMMYSGNDSIYTYTFKHERKDDCPVCRDVARELEIDGGETLQEFIETLAIRPEAQLKKPSIRAQGKSLYMQSPESLEVATRPNLRKRMKDLVSDGDEIGVTDPSLATVSFRFRLKFKS